MSNTRESKQQKALKAIRKAAQMAQSEIAQDIDLATLRLEYIIKKINETWPKL